MSESTESQSSQADSPGAILHAERRRQNFSVGDVSRQLKLSVRQVEALERDEYEMFGSAVFVHGFLRNYAKLLGLDTSSLIAAADRKMDQDGMLSQTKGNANQEKMDAPVISETEQKSLVPLFIAAAVLIAGIAGWVLVRDEKVVPEQDIATMVVQSEEQVLVTRESDAPLTEPGKEASVDAVARSEPMSSDAGDGATGLPDASTVATPVVREGRQAVLYFDFFDESWVEVTDRYGDIIYADLNPPGISQRISGYAPLTVVIGNASGTVLTYNGVTIDLAPHTRVDVARLTVE